MFVAYQFFNNMVCQNKIFIIFQFFFFFFFRGSAGESEGQNTSLHKGEHKKQSEEQTLSGSDNTDSEEDEDKANKSAFEENKQHLQASRSQRRGCNHKRSSESEDINIFNVVDKIEDEKLPDTTDAEAAKVLMSLAGHKVHEDNNFTRTFPLSDTSKTAVEDIVSDSEQMKKLRNSAIAEHDYFITQPEGDESEETDSADDEAIRITQEIWIDHNYCLPSAQMNVKEPLLDSEQPSKAGKLSKEMEAKIDATIDEVISKVHKKAESKKQLTTAAASQSKKSKGNKRLVDVTNKSKVSRELANILMDVEPKPKITFTSRTIHEERQVFFDIYHHGVDDEDINYLKRTYDSLMQSEDPMFYWLNDILWVDHSHTCIPDPPKKRRRVEDNCRVHKTGELFYLFHIY